MLCICVTVSSVAEPEQEHAGENNIQSLKHKLSRARELRKDIDKMREVISNKYAEDMSDNLNCITQ